MASSIQNYLEFKNTPVAFKMLFVEGGLFDMGGKSGYDDSLPVHKVQVSSFWMGEFAVTQAVWAYVMKENPSDFKEANRPVENVSYEDIVKEFLPRLNTMTGCPAGNEYRLPTEAEWEYAARGGKYGEKYRFDYSGSNKLDEVGWYYANSHQRMHVVGVKTPNLLGLYDMSGNVEEWCIGIDWYRSSHKGITVNPTGSAKGAFGVYRGGSWGHYAESCRSTCRYNYMHAFTGSVGFRLVLSFSPVGYGKSREQKEERKGVTSR